MPPGKTDMGAERNVVLIVDDEPAVRELLTEYLVPHGFEILQAGNGLEALLQVKRRRPGAVLLDLMMPRLGGLDALKRIRAFDPSILVVVVTGFLEPDIHRQALALGAAAVLTKPIAADDLLAALGRPREASTASAAPASPPVAAPPTASAGRVLVVDDEPEVREMLTEFLTLAGYAARAAEDGASAIRAVEEEAPDAILLDIEMPRLGGVETLTAIRAIDPDIKVIMVSGTTSVDLARSALAHGAFDYVVKPVDMAYLEQSLQAALATRRPAH